MEIDSYYYLFGNMLYTVQLFLSSGPLLEPPVSGQEDDSNSPWPPMIIVLCELFTMSHKLSLLVTRLQQYILWAPAN